MVAHPNRWLAKPGEVTLAENVVFENDMLQKEPSAKYYDIGGAEDAKFSGDCPPAGDNLAGVVGFPMAQFVLGSAAGFATGSTAPGSPWVVTTTNGANAGDLYVVGLTREAGTGAASAITDSKGNTYSLLLDDSSAGLRLQIWASILTTTLTGSDTLSITLNDATADVNVVVHRYSAVSSITPVDTGSAASLNPDFATTSVHSSIYPVLWVGVVAHVNAAAVFTMKQGYASVESTTAGAHITAQAFRFDTGFPGITGLIEWTSSAVTTPAGSIAVTLDSKTVTGSGTAFTTDFFAGDEIVANGQAHRVDTVTSATVLTTVDPWSTTGTGLAYTRRAGPKMVTSTIRYTDAAGKVGALLKEKPESGITTNRGNLNAINLVLTLSPAVRSAKFVVGGKEVAANNRKLFFLNGVDPIQVVSGDGNTATAISNPAADWGSVQDPNKQPINGIVHQDSLMVFGNMNDPHRLYISSTTDHENFTSAGGSISLKIASQIGERLYAAAAYQGVLFLWKYPSGIFYLDDTPIDRFQWGYRIRSVNVGCAPSPHAAVSIDDDVLFCDPNGHFHLLSAVDTLGGTRDSDLTRALGLQDWTKTNVDVDALHQLVSVYDQHTKTAWFGLRSLQGGAIGRTQNDLIIRFDFGQGQPRVSTSRFWQPQSLAVKRRDFTGVSAVMIGEAFNAWYVIPTLYGTRTNRTFLGVDADVNVGVNTRVDLPEHDFEDDKAALRHIQKDFHSLEVVFQNTPNLHPLTIELRVDGYLRETVTFSQTNRRRASKRIHVGSGYTITARLITDGAVIGDLPIIGLIIYYEPTSSDMSRKN
jgi:hypothetical protein